MQVVHLKSSYGVGLQVALRQVRDFLEDGETSIFITDNDTMPSLAGPGAARVNDPETAKEAAKLDREERRRQVARGLIKYGPGISDDIADGLGIDRSWVTSRLNDLRTKYDPPLAVKTGRKIVNPRSGRRCEEWRITEFGVAWIQGEE